MEYFDEKRLILHYLAGGDPYARQPLYRLIMAGAGPEALLSFDKESFTAYGFGKKTAALFRNYNKLRPFLIKELAELKEKGIRFITWFDEAFPERLRTIPDPPLWLYVRGSLPPESGEGFSAAVIGSRAADSYGLRMAEYASETLAAEDIWIVSGMAKGIDSAAHRAAIRSGGKTLAVLGNGIDLCYPSESRDVYECLSRGEQGGIVSEYPPGADSLKWHFPERNRLIAAFSDCLILVEARSVKSGSLITVDCALDQGKPVFAVPGRITDPLSRGCNDLIKNGAFLFTGPEDVIQLSGVGTVFDTADRNRESGPAKRKFRLDDKDAALIYEMINEDPVFPAEITELSGLPPERVMASLLTLELCGLIVPGPGGSFTADYS